MTKEVYFDDLKIEHTKSPVVQGEDYYPFGLTFNSYQRENSVSNRWKFQGQEHIDDLNLGWDSFKWRNHQPDIGRFFNVDPLSHKYLYNSPYAFSENQVVVHRELEGLEKVSIQFSAWKDDSGYKKFSQEIESDKNISTLKLKVDFKTGGVSYKDSKNIILSEDNLKVKRTDGGFQISGKFNYAAPLAKGLKADHIAEFSSNISLNQKDEKLTVNSNFKTDFKGNQIQTTVSGDYGTFVTGAAPTQSYPATFTGIFTGEFGFLPGKNEINSNASFKAIVYTHSDNNLSLQNVSINGGTTQNQDENEQEFVQKLTNTTIK